MVNNQRGSALVQTIWALAGLLVITAATLHVVWEVRASTTNFTTPFHRCGFVNVTSVLHFNVCINLDFDNNCGMVL